jgi:hypothetical protein
MCVTCVFPFVGALRSWSNEAEFYGIEGTCPACDEAGIKVRGGQLIGEKPLSRICPRCRTSFDAVCERVGPESEDEL